jgi:hypothetical protein
MTKRAVSAPETVTVKLRRPLGNRSEIVLRRATAAELRPLPLRVMRGEDGRQTGATWGDLMTIVQGCARALQGGAELELEDLKSLASDDVKRLAEEINAFMDFDVKKARAEQIKKLPNGSATLKLSRPLQLGSERVESLELKPASGNELWDMPVEPSIDDLLTLGSKLSLRAGVILDRLDVQDALLLIELCSGFFDRSRKGGG